MTAEVETALKPYIEAVLAKKAGNVVALDVHELTSIADAFIICSGRSNRQVSALAEHIERELKKQKIRPLSVEGAQEGQWVLMDYGNVIVHVFFESVREFYDLEGLWRDARRIRASVAPKPRAAAARRTRAGEPEA